MHCCATGCSRAVAISSADKGGGVSGQSTANSQSSRKSSTSLRSLFQPRVRIVACVFSLISQRLGQGACENDGGTSFCARTMYCEPVDRTIGTFRSAHSCRKQCSFRPILFGNSLPKNVNGPNPSIDECRICKPDWAIMESNSRREYL